jgi:hypothetical protein
MAIILNNTTIINDCVKIMAEKHDKKNDEMNTCCINPIQGRK